MPAGYHSDFNGWALMFNVTVNCVTYHYMPMPGILDTIRVGLSLEKQRDYRNIVVVQVVIIVIGLTFTEFLEGGSRTDVSKTIIIVFSLFGVTYAFLLWDLLKNFTKVSC
jgi:hypothetical protein